MEYTTSLMGYLAEIDHDKIAEATAVMVNVQLVNSRTVWVIGNGGSATTAEHFAGDLAKNVKPYVSARSTNNLCSLTAHANDDGYDRVFSEQLTRQGRPLDVLVAISTSGESKNVINAMKAAKVMHMVTIGLTAFDGGSVRGLADVSLHTDCDVVEMAEDIHMAMCHNIVWNLKQR